MKILQIIPSLLKGGAERLVLDICNAFAFNKEVEVKLVTFYEDNAYSFLVENIAYNVIPISFKLSLKGKSNGNVFELQKYIDNFQPDIIHSHLFESEIILSQIHYPRAKYFVHFHDNMNQMKKWKGKVSKQAIVSAYERKIVVNSYKKKDVTFIAISKNTLEYIKKNLPKKNKKYLLLNAIDLERFKDNNHERVAKSMLMIGSLVDKKNQKLAIQVVRWLQDKGVYYTLDILGEGPNEKLLESLIYELKLEKYVFLRGNVDNPEDYLKSRSIYLHTAIYEPFGLVLIEAMACKIPIVCTDGKGNKDVIKDKLNGIITDKFFPSEIGKKILLLEKNAEIKEQMIRNAYNDSRKYSIRSYVDKLINIYIN